MGLKIEDGTGSGVQAKVTSTNRLKVTAIAKSPEHVANHESGEAYVLNFSATPTGADDCFMYFKNTGEIDMVMEGFGLHLVANEYLDIKLKDYGSPSGGSEITPVNANAGSGHSAIGTFQNGADIVGLSGGSTLYRIYHPSGSGTIYHNFEMDIVLPKNSVCTFYCQTGTTALEGFINFIVAGQ